MNDEPTLRDIRDLIDSLAAITNANIQRVEVKVDGLGTEIRDLKAEVRDLKSEVRDVKADMRAGWDRLNRHETRIEALESK